MRKCPIPACSSDLVINGYYQVGYCPNERCGAYVCLIHGDVYFGSSPIPSVAAGECRTCRVKRLAIEDPFGTEIVAAGAISPRELTASPLIANPLVAAPSVMSASDRAVVAAVIGETKTEMQT